MEIDPKTFDQREVYKLLIGTVVPRPIAWVSTVDTAGVVNLAPFSFFNGLGSNPPALMVSINHASGRSDDRKDTLRNIIETHEFVVNIVTESTMHAMNQTATDYPTGYDELALAGLTTRPARTIRAPHVAESPVSFECTLHTTIPLGEGPGSTTVVIGIINHMYIDDTLLNDRNYIDIARLQPIGRLAGNSYCYVHDIFELIRPKFTPPST